MLIAARIDSAISKLNSSNIVYVGGAVLTVAAALYVLFENRAVAAGKRVKFYVLAEILVCLAAVASLLGTIGAIHYGNVVGHLKDIESAEYRNKADSEIAQAKEKGDHAVEEAASANHSAASANQKAAMANETAQHSLLEKEKIRADNLRLEQQLEQERAARLGIEQRLAPRAFNTASQKDLASKLPVGTMLGLDVVVVPNNPEAADLARSIVPAFELGWRVELFEPHGGSLRGVWVEYLSNNREALSIAQLLTGSLRQAGIEVFPPVPISGSIIEEFGGYSSQFGGQGAAKIRLVIGSK